jgi:hypothetical protein
MKIFDALAIRNTSNQVSGIVEEANVLHKTYIIENSLDQAVDLTFEASANEDFSGSFQIGTTPWTVAATTNTYGACATMFPYVRITAKCNIAPTTGVLTVHVFKYSGA